MKSQLKLIVVTSLILQGCSVFEYKYTPSPAVIHYQNQLDSLMLEVTQWRSDWDKRMLEIEESYQSKRISESEYLTLKNSLKKEKNDYAASVDERRILLKNQVDYKIHQGL